MKPEPKRDDKNVPWCQSACQQGSLCFCFGICRPQVEIDEAELARLQAAFDEVTGAKRPRDAIMKIGELVNERNALKAVVEKLHPRVLKLAARENEPFIVIGVREPYFMEAYNLIREHEKSQGTWTREDGVHYGAALLDHGERMAIDAFDTGAREQQ